MEHEHVETQAARQEHDLHFIAEVVFVNRVARSRSGRQQAGDGGRQGRQAEPHASDDRIQATNRETASRAGLYQSSMVALRMVESDEHLVDRSLRGEREAFDQLVARYQSPVYHFALRFCGHPEDARELAQDIFVRAYLKLSTFQPGKPFRPWLYRVAGSVCLNHRARRRPVTVPLEPVEQPGGEPAGPGPDPAALAAAGALRQQLYEAVRQLPASYRAVMLLRHLDGLDYREIADSLKLPLGTLRPICTALATCSGNGSDRSSAKAWESCRDLRDLPRPAAGTLRHRDPGGLAAPP